MTTSVALARTLPTAYISRGAIRANLLQSARRDVLVGAEHDALGHGAELVRDIAHELGFAGITGEVEGVTDSIAVANVVGAATGTRPALRLCGEVLGIKDLRVGEGVSYGYTFVAERDTRIALVTGGYAQGIVRSLGNRANVTINSEQRRIIGRVAMDACVVDIGDADVNRGDEVVFLGDPAIGEPAVADWCTITGMQTEEILMQLGLRARRVETA